MSAVTELNHELGRDYATRDGHKLKLIHQEYSTTFGYKGKILLAPTLIGHRGHYDLVILNPIFIEANNTESITNRLLKNSVADQNGSIDAVIEFKLSYRGWIKGLIKGCH